MSNFADLILGADTTGLVKGEAALTSIAKTGAQTEAKVAAAMAGMGHSSELLAAAVRAAAATETIARISASQEAQNAADRVTAAAQARQRAEQAAADAIARAARQEAAAREAAASSYSSLKASLDPAYAATLRYERAVETTTAAVRMQIITQEEANSVLGMVEKQIGGVGKSGFAAGGGLRMLGQQLSQVAQQGAVTGNYLGALAVQLPDMALGFGTVAIAASIVATVALPLLTSAFSTNTEAAKLAEEATRRLSDAQDDLADSSRNTQVEIDKLRFGVDEGYQVELLREQIRLRDEYNAKTAELAGYMATTTDSLDRQRVKTAELRGEIETVAAAYNRNAASLQNQADRATQLAIIQGVIAQRAGEVTARQEEATDAVARSKSLVNGLTGEIDAAAVAMGALVASAPSGGWLAGAISDATTLASKLWSAASALSANRPSDSKLAGAYGLYANTRTQANEAQHATEEATVAAYKLYGQTRAVADAWPSTAKAAKAAGGGMSKAAKEAADALKKAEKEAAKLTEEFNQPMVDAIDSVAGAFGDFIGNGLKDFKGFATSILRSFTSMISQMISTAIANPIKIALGLTGSLGGGGSAASAATGAASSGGGILGSIGTGIAGIASSFGAGLSSVWTALGTGGLSGAAGAIGTALSGATSGLAGLATAAGALVLPVAAVAAVFSFFKKKTTELNSGLRVTVDGLDAAVQTFSTVETKRFWGLSKKVRTNYNDASSEVADPIANAVASLQTSVMDSAKILGIGAAAFDAFAYTMTVSTKGLSDADAQKAVEDALLGLSDNFAGLVPGIKALQKDGEGATEAVSRLAKSLTAVNMITDTLGLSFEAIGLAGADMASQLADAFGSIDGMNSATTAYYSKFYTEAERTATSTRQTTEALAKLGLTMPTTRDQYRALVSAQDLTTEAGRNAFAALVGLSGVMDTILPQVGELSAAFGDMQKTLLDYIRNLVGVASELITPAQALLNSQAEYQRALLAAINGEDGAAAALTTAATAMISSTKAVAGSSFEVARAQAMVVSQLNAVSGGGLALGTSGNTTSGQASTVYAVPTVTSGGSVDATTADLLAAIKALRDEVTALREQNLIYDAQVASNTKRGLQLGQQWEATGLPPARAVL